MEKKVKSGKEILNDFFDQISKIKNVDKLLANELASLYKQGKLTDTYLKNALQKLRDKNGN